MNRAQKIEYLRGYRKRRENQLAAERLDVLEPPPPKRGCNARGADGKRCGKRVVQTYPGRFTIHRLCTHHAAAYAEHEYVLYLIQSTRVPP